MKREHLLKTDTLLNLAFLLTDVFRDVLGATPAPEGIQDLIDLLAEENAYPVEGYADKVVDQIRIAKRGWAVYKRRGAGMPTAIADQALLVAEELFRSRAVTGLRDK